MSGYIESYRGHVLSNECDLFGHMNVTFYNACLAQAMTTMMTSVGVDPEEAAETRRGLAAVEQNSKYYAELLAGDIIHMESGVLKSSNKTISFHHKLFNSATNVLAYECVVTAAYMDLDARTAIPLDTAVHAKLAELGTIEEAA
ncbi:acyl-CoA thioesterase [Sneathiella chinensis]|uniref:Thioesterase n=1 Tax=Sneathiella chinensis TaxID=349750 RepID=A0ABQ5U0V6_9PROT|nr:thioesterase family protein [Sneathiella chinensis]GLQ05489.1 thioesterase [Sneathiella chinensis]